MYVHTHAHEYWGGAQSSGHLGNLQALLLGAARALEFWERQKTESRKGETTWQMPRQ